jgi:transcriptional regulator with XRE-family HTH domain
MKTQQWRIEMRLTPGGREMLRFLMKREGLTIERLAERCGGRKHMSSIGHLLTGYRAGCNDDLALAIERVLLDKGFGELRLFEPRVSRVAGNGATSSRRAA